MSYKTDSGTQECRKTEDGVCPGESGGGGGITSINGNTTAAQTIAAGAGISVVSGGGTTTITNTGSVGNFANRQLSNLSGTTAVNLDLNMGNNSIRQTGDITPLNDQNNNIGGTGLAYNQVFTEYVIDTTGGAFVDLSGGLTAARLGSNTAEVRVLGAGHTEILNSDLQVGNDKFHVDGNGNITKINNVVTSWPASQGSSSTFLENDGSGNLSWASAGGGGGANTSLSNLITTSINEDLTPDGNLTRNLGTSTLSWNSLYVNDIQIAQGTNYANNFVTLTAGTVTVFNTLVTSTSQIQLTSYATGTVPAGVPYISSINSGTSFVISSTNLVDDNKVGYVIFSTVNQDHPPLAGLLRWYKVNTGMYQDVAATIPALVNGDPVLAWKDQSGNNATATNTGSNGAQNSTLVTGSINGNSAVNFTQQDFFGFTLSSTPNAFGYCVVDAFDLSVTGKIYLSDQGANQYAYFGSFTSGSSSWDNNTGARSNITPLTNGGGGPAIYGFGTGSGNKYSYFNDGHGPIYSAPVGGASTVNMNGLSFASPGNADNFLGNMLEVLYYDHKLTGPEQTIIESYFNLKYNLAPTPPLTNLILHLIGGVGMFQDTGMTIPATTNGDPLLAWQDQSVSANHLTNAASTFEFQSNTINGLPGAFVNVPNAQLFFTTGLNIPQVSSFVILQQSNTGTCTLPLSYNSVSPYLNYNGNGQCVNYVSYTCGGHAESAATITAGYGTPTVIGCIQDGSAYHSTYNGASGTIISNSSNCLFNTIGYATWNGSAYSFNGSIAEILIYDTALTGAPLLQVKNYITFKYGITLV